MKPAECRFYREISSDVWDMELYQRTYQFMGTKCSFWHDFKRIGCRQQKEIQINSLKTGKSEYFGMV
jgi:hypothetical protein